MTKQYQQEQDNIWQSIKESFYFSKELNAFAEKPENNKYIHIHEFF